MRKKISDKVIHNQKSQKYRIFDLYTKLSTDSTKIKKEKVEKRR